MGKVVCDITVSADGYSAGPNQTREDPLGAWGERLHKWMFDTDESKSEVDRIVDAGAFIMGRNMFGPIRGEWGDEDWRGWWGPVPPYHGPVFVLTHYPHETLTMEGGTSFVFVTDGIESALAQARAAAGERNISIAGGASTVNQFLAARLIDELRVHVAPVLLGSGERPFDGLPPQELELVESRGAALVAHMTYRFGR